jgi:hypothetical protein
MWLKAAVYCENEHHTSSYAARNVALSIDRAHRFFPVVYPISTLCSQLEVSYVHVLQSLRGTLPMVMVEACHR